MAEIFRVLNRGVDKRIIYLDEGDYFRFIHDMFEFNDKKPINNNSYFFRKSNIAVAFEKQNTKREPRKL